MSMGDVTDQFEELRKQYRAEALRAVKLAEQRGYDKAVAELSDQIKKLSDECQVAALRGQRVDNNATKMDAIIRQSMEQVYRNLKQEFDDGSEVASLFPRFKTALRASAVALHEKFSKARTSLNEDNVICRDLTFYRRPSIIAFRMPPADNPFLLDCTIESYDVKQSSGLFGSKYISYKILSSVTDGTGTGRIICQNAVSRRYSDFVTLEKRLRDLAPRCILPILPPKEVSRQTSDNLVIQRRLRYLRSWLRFIAGHHILSILRCFGEFISDQHSPDAWMRSLNNEINSKKSDQYACNESEKYLSLNTIILVNRDFSQLSHHMTESLASSKKLCLSLMEYSNAAHAVATVLQEAAKLGASEDENFLLNAFHRSAIFLMEQMSFFRNSLLNMTDSVRFFGQPCMESARSLLDRTNSFSRLSENSVSAIHSLSAEWQYFRSSRQSELSLAIIDVVGGMKQKCVAFNADLAAVSAELETFSFESHAEHCFRSDVESEISELNKVYGNLRNRVSVTLSTSTKGLQYLERATLPQGVRRDPVKIFNRIKPELSSTVDPVHMEEKLCDIDNECEDNEFEDNDLGVQGDRESTINEKDSEIKYHHGTRARTRRYAAGAALPSGATSSAGSIRHRQQQPRKSAPATVPSATVPDHDSPAESTNFIAKSYGQVSSSWHSSSGRRLVESNAAADTRGASTSCSSTPTKSETYSWNNTPTNPNIINSRVGHADITHTNRKRAETEVFQKNQNDQEKRPLKEEFLTKDDTSAADNSDGEDVFSTRTVESNDYSVPTALDGWEEVSLPSEQGGGVYYYHRKTRVSRWEKPDEKVAAAMEARLREEQQKVDQAVQRRRDDRESNTKKQQDALLEQEKLQSKIQSIMMSWKKPEGAVRQRNIAELLGSISTVVSLVATDEFVCSESVRHLSLKTASPEEIRKCYMKIVRLIHPDKISALATNEERFIAEAAFVVLTDSYQGYLGTLK